MEKNKKNKSTSNAIIAFVILLLLVVLIIFVTQYGLDSTEGVVASIAICFFIISGLIKLFKPVIRSSTDSSIITSATHGNNQDTSSQVNSGVTTPQPSMPIQTAPVSSHPFMDQIKNLLSKIPPKHRPYYAIGGFVVIIIIIIVSFTVFQRIAEPDTTITGTWTHEIGNTSLQDENTWVMNLTNWNVDTRYDTGIIYMYVNEDGTFTVIYDGDLVCEGTWEERSDDYLFHQWDPDGILMGMYTSYQINGSDLCEGIVVVFTKE